MTPVIDETVARRSQRQRIGLGICLTALGLVSVAGLVFVRLAEPPGTTADAVLIPLTYVVVPAFVLLYWAQTTPEVIPRRLRPHRTVRGGVTTYVHPRRAVFVTYLPLSTGLIWLSWVLIESLAATSFGAFVIYSLTAVFVGYAVTGHRSTVISREGVLATNSYFGINSTCDIASPTDVTIVPGNFWAKQAAAQWVDVTGTMPITYPWSKRVRLRTGGTISNIIVTGRDVNLMARDIAAAIRVRS